MEKKEIEIGPPINIGEISIVPIAELAVRYPHAGDLVSFFGVKRPVAVVVFSPEGKKAFRPSGEEVPLEQLMQEAPVLRGTLPDMQSGIR